MSSRYMRSLLRQHFGVFVITLCLGMTGALTYAVWKTRTDSRQKIRPIAFEQLPLIGFDEVTSAKTGDLVTIDGFIDIKGLCNRSGDLYCEASFGRGPAWQWIPIRLRICTDQTTTNCITRLRVPVDFRDVWVVDRNGNQVDFDGTRLIEEPNTWTSKDLRLRITGRVTIVNGVGRFLDPIEIVGESPNP